MAVPEKAKEKLDEASKEIIPKDPRPWWLKWRLGPRMLTKGDPATICQEEVGNAG